MTLLLGLLFAAVGAQAMRPDGEGAHATAAGGIDGVGRLTCRTAGGGAAEEATGWLVGAADTVATAAHLLFPGARSIDPRGCVFHLVNPDGSVRQSARVVYARSPWTDPAQRHDSAHDVAILKLDRPMAVAAVPAAARSGGSGIRPVRLISFPGDAGGGPARISRGEARPFPFGAGGAGGMRISDPSRLFASSADSAAGSSGGMYYAPGSGAAIGLHVGYACGAGRDGCVNFGLRFDGALLALIAAVAADRPGGGTTTLASADLGAAMRGAR